MAGSSSIPTPTLPDAETLGERLAETEPRPVPVSRRALPIAAVGLALAFALFGPPLLGTLAPWVALGGIAVAAVLRARTARRLAAALSAAEDLLRLRRPAEAYAAADALLPEFVHEPGPSAQCVHLMARSRQALRHPEAARVAASTLLDRLPPHHPARTPVLVNLAISEFESDRLADGDATLGRLRSTLERSTTPAEAEAAWAGAGPTDGGDRRSGRPFARPERSGADYAAAAFRTARLIQSVCTYHVADAIADVATDGGAEVSFRPLGVEAGFAHGLLAWCHWKLHDAEAAASAWTTASRLVPVDALVHRFPRLEEIAAVCPAAGELPA